MVVIHDYPLQISLHFMYKILTVILEYDRGLTKIMQILGPVAWKTLQSIACCELFYQILSNLLAIKLLIFFHATIMCHSKLSLYTASSQYYKPLNMNFFVYTSYKKNGLMIYYRS